MVSCVGDPDWLIIESEDDPTAGRWQLTVWLEVANYRQQSV